MKTQLFCVTFLLICFTLPPATTAQVVDIPDPNLHTAIAAALGKASDHTITVPDMANLTELDAKSAKINNLTGLEAATNLTNLNLWGNSISDILPLANLTNLTSLHLGYNPISDISPLANLTLDMAVPFVQPYIKHFTLGKLNQPDRAEPFLEQRPIRHFTLGKLNQLDISGTSAHQRIRYFTLDKFNQSDRVIPSEHQYIRYFIFGKLNQLDEDGPFLECRIRPLPLGRKCGIRRKYGIRGWSCG